MNADQAPEWLPSFLVPFITLSYPIDPPAVPDSFANSGYYSTGLLDGCVMVSYIAIMAVLRDVVRLYVLEPFAYWMLTRGSRNAKKPIVSAAIGAANGVSTSLINGSANGHTAPHTNGSAHKDKNGHPMGMNGFSVQKMGSREKRQLRRSVLRFAEQGWALISYTMNWAFGLYIHRNLPTAPFEPTRLWLNYPHVHLSGPLKLYYLVQTAFYVHQVLILNAEARRKDHVQMMTHHVVTIALMVASYFYNFTRVGCLIMVLMDWCDIWLPLAKMFRYLNYSTLCDISFAFFTLSWAVTRHYFFLRIIWSAYFDAPRLIPFEWAPERGHYLTHGTFMAFIAMLVALQLLQILWFKTILGIVWRVVSAQGAEDTRSDDEDDDLSEEGHDTKRRVIPDESDSKKKR